MFPVMWASFLAALDSSKKNAENFENRDLKDIFLVFVIYYIAGLSEGM